MPHWLTEPGGKYYDPSYGTQPAESPQDYESQFVEWFDGYYGEDEDGNKIRAGRKNKPELETTFEKGNQPMKKLFMILIFVALIAILIKFQFSVSESKIDPNVSSRVTQGVLNADTSDPSQLNRETIDIPNSITLSETIISVPSLGREIDLDEGKVNEINENLRDDSVEGEKNDVDLNTVLEARQYLLERVSMVEPPVVFATGSEFFYFSGGLSADKVTNFSSGYAVSRNGGQIFTWELPETNSD